MQFINIFNLWKIEFINTEVEAYLAVQKIFKKLDNKLEVEDDESRKYTRTLESVNSTGFVGTTVVSVLKQISLGILSANERGFFIINAKVKDSV